MHNGHQRREDAGEHDRAKDHRADGLEAEHHQDVEEHHEDSADHHAETRDRRHGEDHEARLGERSSPRILASSLSDYNNGELHGTWIDAGQEPEQIHEEIRAMLGRSRAAGAEEWAIHDYEGFGPIQLSEYESLEVVSRLATGIAEHGEAFAHYVELFGTEPHELDKFEERYLGTWPSLEAYAEDMLEDMGVEPEKLLPSWLSPYVRVDYEGLGRDMGSEMMVGEGGEGVWLFQIL
jgi:antirestriction protein